MTTHANATKDQVEAVDNPDLRIYAKITFGYSASYVMPYDHGLKIMAHFNGVMQMDESDYNNHKLVEMTSPPQLTLLTREQYVEVRMNALLTPPDDKN